MSRFSVYDFEEKINSTILSLGGQRHYEGAVKEMDRSDDDLSWRFSVEDSRGYYSVRLHVDEQYNILKHTCTCPFNQGPVCEHVAAAMYEMEDLLTDEGFFDELSKETEYFNPDKPNIVRAENDDLMQKGQNLLHSLFGGMKKEFLDTFQNSGNKVSSKSVTSSAQQDFVKYAMGEYEKLGQVDQNIVLILALAFIEITQNQLKNIYHELNFAGGSPFFGNNNQYLLKLNNKGLIDLRGGYVQCNADFAHFLCEKYFPENKDKIRRILLTVNRFLGTYYWTADWKKESLRKMRLARYQDDAAAFEHEVGKSLRALNHETERILDFWFRDDFDNTTYFDTVHPDILISLLRAKLQMYIVNLELPDALYFVIKKNMHRMPEAHQQVLFGEMGVLAFWQGNFEEVDRLKKTHPKVLNLQLLEYGFMVLQGKYEEAVVRYEAVTQTLRKETKKRTLELVDIHGLLYAFALLGMKTPASLKRVQTLLKKQGNEDNPLHIVAQELKAILFFLENEKNAARDILASQGSTMPLRGIINTICRFLIDHKWLNVKQVRYYLDQSRKNAFHWPALEMLTVLNKMIPNNTILENEQRELQEGLNIQPLAILFPPVEVWETALEQLLQIGKKGQKSADQVGALRVAWLVDFDKEIVQAKEQKLGKSGWSKGKNIADKRLVSGEIPFMTAQDKRIAAYVVQDQYSYSYSYRPRSLNADIWRAMVGHPFLFLEKSPDVALQLVKEEPLLIASKEGSGYRLRFSPPLEHDGLQIIKESPTRYKLIEPTPQQVEIALAFNGDSLFIPDAAEEKLTQAIGGLSNLVTVQSSLVTDTEGIETVESDPRICVHLLPVGDGFHVELYVKPFGENPPYFRPAHGESSVIALVEGKRKMSQRDLNEEKMEAEKLLDRVPILQEKDPIETGQWELPDADDCLPLLLQLNPLLQDGSITLEWPKGEKMRINSVVGFDQFKMSVKSNSDWFEVDGQLQLDSERVLTMRELIDLSNKSKSQFVEVKPGQFIALTEEFKQRLAKINGLLSRQKDGTMQLHALAATAFDPFAELVNQAELDEKFLQAKEKIRTAFSQKYKVPKAFNAELRPYQVEGFQWLHRLANWGVGACLADDMGLGKTVQALAFLTDRAEEGPALVVAPASVCRNWMAETEKFAPALRPMLFGEGDREKMVNKARNGHVVVVTYDLMTREEKLFTEKEWGTIVLDEAQAIKNPGTKRSETAMSLQGKFRLAMSGTPLENHLGELWNLMRFLNPGLLGSAEQFQDRFSGPIERAGDEIRRDQLKRLVQPFILRRRKDEVLKDLPEKTEITLHVSLSPDERAFYEALRQKAVENIHAANNAPAGQKHLQILAELMKLRRAACHPQLADKNVRFSSSSKLELFAETVDELLENGHKALVFSQFVGHLEILENYLKGKGISYQYLDGSTPMKKRQERIEAFQNGEGDLFLISLKAGGVGLNLTAADYVIHMDPWWNPAVEDQATDRAHRIGQEKPVTVYRIVAENTIEEKIIKLHEQKRDLADSLLEGTSQSAKMNAEELLALLEEV